MVLRAVMRWYIKAKTHGRGSSLPHGGWEERGDAKVPHTSSKPCSHDLASFHQAPTLQRFYLLSIAPQPGIWGGTHTYLYPRSYLLDIMTCIMAIHRHLAKYLISNPSALELMPVHWELGLHKLRSLVGRNLKWISLNPWTAQLEGWNTGSTMLSHEGLT